MPFIGLRFVGGEDGWRAVSLPAQMRNDWIENVADRLVNTNEPNKMQLGLMLKNSSNKDKIIKLVLTVNKSDVLGLPIYLLRLAN